jgi:hypothetical protein
MELCLVKRSLALISSLAAVLCFTSGIAHAQVAGESVNMVSGIAWPGGDPFLQRQNEPTLAVSSANPMHLMAGANDYRSVDIKVPDADVTKINGDAWLGVFKSLDGGQNWKSVLLPGYSQDPGCKVAAAPVPAGHVHWSRCGHTTPPPSAGGQFALCGLPASADPVMRAGTDGMFYLAGINFQRDKKKSRMFLARYIDLNNKENGDATRDTDPIRYVDTRIIAENPLNVFIDKPWMVVDVPRSGAVWCEIPISDIASAPPRRFLGGTIYVGWAEFTLPDDDPATTSTIKLTYSTDCGKTWVKPYALNTKNSVLNQGLALSVEPITGRVLAAWRRIGTPTNKQTDAIMATRSGGRKKNFSGPRVVAKLGTPFDQGSSYTAFRTTAFPVMAISTDGKNSWAHLAWQQRKSSGVNESQIVMSTAKIYPPPAGDGDTDEADDYEPETRVGWSLPKAVDDHPTMVGDDAGNVFSSGHQVMPALTFGQGKLMLVYYDTRFDHTRRYYEPLATPSTTDGRFYKETLAPVGELARATDPSGAPALPVAVFNSWLNDGSLFKVRHTVDVRVAGAPAGGNPVFKSVLASKFPFGIRGDEGGYTKDGLKVPGFGASDVEVVTPAVTDAATSKVTPGTLKVLQQLQSNPPNFPLFKNGSVAFMGDYIDIQGQTFVPTQKGGWAFNSAATPAPVFHAVWTSNQDVQVPRVTDANGFPDWSRYAPPYCATCNAPQASRYANDSKTFADMCVPGAEASRDQNIYTARITEGLLVATPQNMKPLSASVTRSFVVVAQNSSDKDMTVSFAATVPSQGAPATVPAVNYSFTSDLSPTNRTLTSITVPKRSYVARSLFVKLPAANTKALTTLNVSVTETGCPAAACRSGFVTLNPATALGTLVQPDTTVPLTDITLSDAFKSTMASVGLTDPTWINGGKTDPTWINPTWVNNATNPTWVNLGYTDPTWINNGWSDPTWINPPLTNSNWANGAWTSPTWINPTWINQGFTDPSWTDPTWINPTWINPTWINPTWINPTWINPTWINSGYTDPTWVNSPMSDLGYTITNTGNTTTSYHVKVVGPASTATPPAQPPPPIQMNMTKWYNTPASVNCKLIETPRFLPVVEVPAMPLTPADATVDPGAADGSATNATVSLAPGESALIILRANLPMQQMAALGKTIGVAAVPAKFTPDGTKYKDLQASGNGSTVGVGVASTTSLTYDPTSATATVTVTGGTPTPTGAVVVILNGKSLAATYSLTGGVATVGFHPAPGAGDTLAAFYPGDGVYQASTSSSVPVVAVIAPISVRSYYVSGTRQSVGVYTASGSPITNAVVQVSGVSDSVPLPSFTLTHDGNGIYSGTLPTRIYGQGIYLMRVEANGAVVTGAGNMPVVPNITAPTTTPSLNPAAQTNVAWTASVQPDRFNVWGTWFVNPGWGSTDIYTVPGGTYQTNIPANLVPVGAAYVKVEAVNDGILQGDFTPDSYLIVNGGEQQVSVTYANPPPPRLGLFVRAELSYVEVEVLETTTNTQITDANVTFNGVNVPWVGLPWGYYLAFTGTGSLPYATPGMAVNVSVTTLDGRTASATGTYPALQPSITAPANHATPVASDSLAVSWSPVADYYVLMAYCNSLVNSNLCTGGYQRVNGPSTSFTFPPNTFVAGQQAQLWLLNLNYLTFTDATAVGESYAGLNTMVYLDPVAAPTLNMIGTASIELLGVPPGPYTTFWVGVKDPATQAVLTPTDGISVTLTSSAAPTNVMTIPWYGPGQYFGTSWVAINSGDTLMATITRTVGTTVVAQSNCTVAVPGFATLRTMWMPPNPVAGMTVTTTWDYPTNIQNPQIFQVKPSNLGGNPVPTGGTTDREMWYTAFGVPPFTAKITSINHGPTCDGSGSGFIVARTDDNVNFPVTIGAPIP